MKIFICLLMVANLSASVMANRGSNWNAFEQFISKKKILGAAESAQILALRNQTIVREQQRFQTLHGGPFLSMFPGSAPHPANLTNDEVGQPLILTPLLEAGQVQKARELAQVKGISSNKAIDEILTYSGYFTVNKKYDSNLFFWFVPAQFNENAPLIIWLQGGPGGSSMFGFFVEHGPFYVNDKLELIKRSTSWSLPYNVLYIDQPVGTGFSFTKDDRGYATNQEMVADDLYEALKQFYTMFPKLLNQDLYITGESYAGKYVPAISYKIHMMNHAEHSEMLMPLKGLAIGDGLCDPYNQLDYGDFLYQVGLLDAPDRRLVDEHTDLAKLSIELEQWSQATQEFDQVLGIVENRTGLTFYYNYLLDQQPPDFENYPKFLQKSNVRKAIHVGNQTYNDISMTVHQHLNDDMLKSIKPWFQTLLEAGYKTMVYSGQLDVIIAFPQTENFLRNLEWNGKWIYALTPRKIWKVEGHVAGYVRKARNLIQVMVRNAGHILPYDQPKWAFDMIQRFIQEKEF